MKYQTPSTLFIHTCAAKTELFSMAGNTQGTVLSSDYFVLLQTSYWA